MNNNNNNKALHPRTDVEPNKNNNNAFYPRNDIEPRKGGRRFASNQDSVEASIQRLEDYIKKSMEKQYKQNKHQQNKNNQKTKLGRCTIPMIPICETYIECS